MIVACVHDLEAGDERRDVSTGIRAGASRKSAGVSAFVEEQADKSNIAHHRRPMQRRAELCFVAVAGGHVAAGVHIRPASKVGVK